MSDYNVIAGLKIKYLSADPSNPEDGQVWYNSSLGKVRVEGVVGTGAWASGGTLGSPGTTSSAGTQTANVIMGGQRPGNTSNVEEYNGASWSEVNNMPYSAGNLCGTGTQTAALAFGGYQVYRLLTRGGNADTAMEYEVVVYRCSLCILE